MKVLATTRHSTTVEFTGKELREIYAQRGADCVFICHVMGKAVKDITNRPGIPQYPDSKVVISELRALVPKRFKTELVPWSQTIDNNLKSKYLGGAIGTPGVSLRCRINLLKHIPDDHVFTWTFEV